MLSRDLVVALGWSYGKRLRGSAGPTSIYEHRKAC